MSRMIVKLKAIIDTNNIAYRYAKFTCAFYKLYVNMVFVKKFNFSIICVGTFKTLFYRTFFF